MKKKQINGRQTLQQMPIFTPFASTLYALEITVSGKLPPLLKGKNIATPEDMVWDHEGNQAVRKGVWKAVKFAAELR